MYLLIYLFGKRYLFCGHSHQLGILPESLKALFLLRKEITKNILNNKYSEEEKIRADKKQNAIKIILNSAYGAMGFYKFRLYTPECADAITYFSREALKFAIEEFENLKYNIIYADTDSINFLYKDNIKKDLENFNNSLKQKFVIKYVTEINDDYCLLNLKYE